MKSGISWWSTSAPKNANKKEDRKTALEAGMNGHLAKPYDIPAIMETLKTLLK